MILFAKGAHKAMQAKAGRTGHRRPLVLSSHSGKLVTPDPKLENRAHVQ